MLATPATFQGALYASVVERFANHVTLLQNTCPGLVQQIEHGELDTPKTRQILETALRPMLEQGIDTIVLGCTHYPFVIPLIQEIAGPEVRVIDPAPAVVRQVSRLLKSVEALPELPGEEMDRTGRTRRFFTSGDAEAFKMLIPRLAGEAGEVEGVVWNEMEVGVE